MGKDARALAKKLLIVLIVVIGAGAAVGLILYHYRIQIHQESISPCNKWLVRITKQERFLAGVEIRLLILRQENKVQVERDMYLGGEDLIDDIKPDSYRIEWKSDQEFLVRKAKGDSLQGTFILTWNVLSIRD